MVQVLEFRAWDKVNEKMVDVDLIGSKVLKVKNSEWENLEDYELLLYINHQDKHGRKIFTGDIIECEEGWLWVVEYDEKRLAIRIKNQFGETMYLDDMIGILKDCEVKGNKYEGSDLLKFFGGARL